MFVFHLLIGVCVILEQYVALYIFILSFCASFQLSQGNLAFVYMAEVCVDSAMGIVMGCQFGTMMLFSLTVSFMIDSPLGMQGTFWTYAGFNLLAVIFMGLVIKETKGLTPVELKSLYLSRKKVASEVELPPKEQEAQ